MSRARIASLIIHLLAGLVLGAFVLPLPVMVLVMTGVAPRFFEHAPLSPLSGLIGAGLSFILWRSTRPLGPPDTHGSARFSTAAEVKASLGGDDGLIVGRNLNPKASPSLFRYAGDAHLLTIAPTRSGKGVGAIIPNLLTLNRSILCIDPKGENVRITARARAQFGPVHVLDPFGVSGHSEASFNPLAAFEIESLDLAEDAALIAESLVYDPPHQTGEAHWNEEAKALITGVILHVVTSLPPASRHLGTVRDYLTRDADGFLSILQTMKANYAAGGLVERAANRHLAKSDREAAGVLSAAQRHTHFLDSPRMTKVMERSAFKFETLRSEIQTVFLVLPPERLGTHARWLRLMVVQAVNALARSGPSIATSPVLLLLDEFAALGRLEPVERAFGLMAGYGIQLWAILQDMHQLKNIYGGGAGTFLSNAGLIQVFNVADVETAQWVSRLLGVTTEAYSTSGSSVSRQPGNWSATTAISTSAQLTRRDLMTPDEVMRLATDELLLIRPSMAPSLAKKVRFYRDAEFADRFDA